MNPADLDALRATLARHFDRSAFLAAYADCNRYYGERRAQACSKADGLIAGPLVPLIAKAESADRLMAENDRLRASLANGGGPCAYCSLTREDWPKCASGFPGCARADDAMLCPHVGAELETADKLKAATARADRLAAGVEALRAALLPFVDAAAGIPASVADCAAVAQVARDAVHPGTIRMLTAGEFRRATSALAADKADSADATHTAAASEGG